MSMMGLKSCFNFIQFIQPKLMVTSPKI
uniref:Uncharacterized protein n=1 Tax=Arundo donax TaxID=35708 RepID=A0A0A8YY72_ARUDO